MVTLEVKGLADWARGTGCPGVVGAEAGRSSMSLNRSSLWMEEFRARPVLLPAMEAAEGGKAQCFPLPSKAARVLHSEAWCLCQNGVSLEAGLPGGPRWIQKCCSVQGAEKRLQASKGPGKGEESQPDLSKKRKKSEPHRDPEEAEGPQSHLGLTTALWGLEIRLPASSWVQNRTHGVETKTNKTHCDKLIDKSVSINVINVT